MSQIKAEEERSTRRPEALPAHGQKLQVLQTGGGGGSGSAHTGKVRLERGAPGRKARPDRLPERGLEPVQEPGNGTFQARPGRRTNATASFGFRCHNRADEERRAFCMNLSRTEPTSGRGGSGVRGQAKRRGLWKRNWRFNQPFRWNQSSC